VRLRQIPAAAIPREWEWVERRLSRAIDTDPQRAPADVLAGLVAGDLVLWLITGPEASGLAVTTAGTVGDTDRTGFWILYAEGDVGGGPRQRIATYRDMVGLFEEMARDCGTDEIWIEARPEWGRALVDFETVAAQPGHASYRKVLGNG